MATSKGDRLLKEMINYNNLTPEQQRIHDEEVLDYLVSEFKKKNIEVREDASTTKH